VLESYKNSISLHQAIGQYLGVDKFQMGRVHQTLSGEMVRSKSEVIIADKLTRYQIPFEYEKRLEAGGYGFWPDFTIKVGDQTYYWEHLGLLDLEQYRQNWAIKKAWYDQYFPGQLLITEEGSTVSQSAELLIKKHLLKDTEEAEPSVEGVVDQKKANITSVKVWTEGKTDWKHLKAAFTRLKADGLFTNLEIQFQENIEEMGDKDLLNSCRLYSHDQHQMPIFFLFDRDVPDTISKVKDTGQDYKHWENEFTR